MKDKSDYETKQKLKWKTIFHKYDYDRSGTIDAEELDGIFKELRVKKTPEEIQEILKISQKDAGSTSNELTFDQFCELFSISKLLKVFQELDTDNSGSIDAAELSGAMRKLGYKLSKAQCTQMLQKVDIDGNGEISFDEFREFFENQPHVSLHSIGAQWANVVLETDCGTGMAPTLPSTGLYWWQTMIAGGLAGVLSRTVTAPLEKVKIVAQTGTGLNKGMIHELRSIVSLQGVRGLFAGNLANCLRIFPTAGITCTVYLKLLKLTPADDELDIMEPVYRMGCGAAAALVANVVTYPLDLIQAKLTVAEGGQQKAGIRKAFQEIVRSSQGFAGLYRGLVPTLLTVVPFIAVQNAAIDGFKDLAVMYNFEATPVVLLGAGAGAGILAQAVVYPLDVLRRRMQLQQVQQAAPAGVGIAQANMNVVADSTWLSLRQLIRTGGVRGLFAGIVPTFLKTIPAVAIIASVKGTLNQHFKDSNYSNSRVQQQKK